MILAADRYTREGTQHVSTILSATNRKKNSSKDDQTMMNDALILLFLSHSYLYYKAFLSGPGSSVGIVTGYGLDCPGARFFAPVQTGPGAHPTSCTMGTGSFAGLNRPGRGSDHPPPPRAEVENE
jgi:hypothetical protein